MKPVNIENQYLFRGLNSLEAKLKQKGITPSQALLRFIDRRMVSHMIATKVEPTPENMDKEYDKHAKQHGGEMLMYRHFAQKQVDSLVTRSMDDLKFNEKIVNELREMEFEPSLQKLRGKNEAANLRMTTIGHMIKQTKDLLDMAKNGNHTAKFSQKMFDEFVDKSDVLQASESLFESVTLSIKDEALDFFKPTLMKATG